MALWNPSNNNVACQFGMPLFGISGTPPFTGNAFWVDETNGSDGNTGGPQDPLKTLTQALAVCTNNNNDVVFLTGTVHVTATVAWNKSRTHLIGLAPKLDSEARARISQTGTTVFSPLVNVTGSECIFSNIGAFHGFVDLTTQICWAEAGQRNQYVNCAFLGMGNATGGASQTGSRSLTVGAGGQGENTFTNCIIGLDTIVRSAANASLEFLGGSPRNVFRNCLFPADTSSASALFITVGASGLDRWAMFDNCTFMNCIESGSTTMSAGIIANASAGGAILLNPSSIFLGVTAIATTGPVYGVGMNPGGETSATTDSIAIKYT
jgi:hypothetical protein